MNAYVTAVNGKDLDGLVRAFAAGAEIVDVGRSIRGHDAIRRWAQAEVIGGTLTVTQVAETRDGYQRLLVRFAPGGTGGFAAYYAFTVDGSSITRAELTYA
ncbi:nuclear transport factor 2 family protein [Streptodolium elevatio]